MSSNDTIGKTLGVALALCIVCSLVVSTAAVMLRPAQDANKEIDRQRNILAAAGMLKQGESISEQFSHITARAVNLDTGEYTDAVDISTYDQVAAAKDPDESAKLGDKDTAGIGRRENIGLVYLVENQGKIEKIILPVRGYGLWSTLYGFLALEGDANTVIGLGFYQHGETPGLGGEVDNPNWKALWHGKKVYEDGGVELHLVKGSVDSSTPDAEYKVDGLSGATLTSRGVTHLIQFWLGENGYAPFLQNLRAGEV